MACGEKRTFDFKDLEVQRKKRNYALDIHFIKPTSFLVPRPPPLCRTTGLVVRPPPWSEAAIWVFIDHPPGRRPRLVKYFLYFPLSCRTTTPLVGGRDWAFNDHPPGRRPILPVVRQGGGGYPNFTSPKFLSAGGCHDTRSCTSGIFESTSKKCHFRVRMSPFFPEVIFWGLTYDHFFKFKKNHKI